MENNFTVYVIGGDHHNTLAIIRCLGKEKVNMKILIHGNFNSKKDIKVHYSKYSKNLEFVQDSESAILNWLLNNKKEGKVILFPSSDLAAYTIDNNSEILKKDYIIPEFKNKSGNIIKMMDKNNQKKWTDKHKINMANSWNVSFSDKNFIIPDNMIYPCIIKPQISALGVKSDITICQNKEELIKAIDDFKNKNYSQALVQEFIKKDFEVGAIGCVINNKKKYLYYTLKKLRENSLSGGSQAFAKFFVDERVNEFVENILSILYNEGYRGMFDIELFICKDKIYLNEINFRHSGNGFAVINNGVKCPYIWCLDALEYDIKSMNMNLTKPNQYFMNETIEFNLLLQHQIGFFEFLSEIIKVSNFSKLNIRDIRGSFGFLIGAIKNKVKRTK